MLPARWLGLVAALGAALLPATGCQRAERFNGGGSTLIFPLMLQWSRSYEKRTGVQVDYVGAGSGNGIQQMTVRTIDFGCTDDVMTPEQVEKANALAGPDWDVATQGDAVAHVPLSLAALVPVYHLAGLSAPLRFDADVLADVFNRRITRWDDPRLAALNPGVALPGQEIMVVRRSDASGTTAIWTQFLGTSGRWGRAPGKTVDWAEGTVGQRGNEGVVGQVQRSPGSIGYAELGYVELVRDPRQPAVDHGSVRNPLGEFVRATPAGVQKAAEASIRGGVPRGLKLSLLNVAGAGAYPVCGTTYAVFYKSMPPERLGPLLAFFRWAVNDGQPEGVPLGYAPLPPDLVRSINDELDRLAPP
jgi:phosphate transport system substrate-binding protein